MSKFLSEVKSGRVENPYKIVMYGVEGVGKSSFAADAPNPIFLDVEGGTEELDVNRLPRAKTFSDVLAMIDELGREPHEFKTLVVDTADWLESLIWKHVCSELKVESIEEPGYGKGYTAALEHWRVFLARLEALRTRRKMNVIILAHSHIRKFSNPADDDYERYELKLNAKAAGVLKEWPSTLLFVNYEVFAHTDKNKRTRGVGEGARVVHTENRPAWDAKNRYGLPEKMGLSWEEFDAAAKSRTPVAPEKSAITLDELIEQCPPALQVQAKGAKKRAGDDAIKIAKVTDWLRGKLNQAAA